MEKIWVGEQVKAKMRDHPASGMQSSWAMGCRKRWRYQRRFNRLEVTVFGWHLVPRLFIERWCLVFGLMEARFVVRHRGSIFGTTMARRWSTGMCTLS